MRLAIVCDDLIQKGGQERLVIEACKIWSNPVLYTSVASEYWKAKCKNEGITLKVSFLQKFPFIQNLYRYYSLFLLHVLAIESFDLSKYDVVLSISSRYAHHAKTKPGAVHICYMNSPGRMFWEPFTYFENEKVFRTNFAKSLLHPFLSYFRMIDYIAAQKVDYFVANAKTPYARIKKYYHRDAAIIYPPVDISSDALVNAKSERYFLIISRLVAWKHIDIAIGACNKLGIRLKILGDGPDKSRLMSMAGKTIEFLGYVSDEKKFEIVSKCSALINTQAEDFGLVPVEVMSHGKPVIAYAKGGALETVLPGKTGDFFYSQTVDALIACLKDFDETAYSPSDCRAQAEIFHKKVFVSKLKRFVEKKVLFEQ